MKGTESNYEAIHFLTNTSSSICVRVCVCRNKRLLFTDHELSKHLTQNALCACVSSAPYRFLLNYSFDKTTCAFCRPVKRDNPS